MSNATQIQLGNVTYDIKDQLTQDALSVTKSSPLRQGRGYVQSADGTLVQATSIYSFSALIKVEPGEQYRYRALASSAILFLAAYSSEEDENAIIEKSIAGTSPATV